MLKTNFKRVLNLLTTIPKGKVTTYKAISDKLRLNNPRLVGNYIHQNLDPETYPCHRVIRSDGKIASGYAFGGSKIQIQKLEAEGVTVVGGKVNLQKYFFELS